MWRHWKENKTWKLGKLPIGKKPLGCKVTYRADGYTRLGLWPRLIHKTYGIDYQGTLYLALVANNKLRCTAA